MDALDRFDLLLGACAALAVVAFEREVVAGLLRAIGGDLWGWVKHRWVRQDCARLH